MTNALLNDAKTPSVIREVFCPVQNAAGSNAKVTFRKKIYYISVVGRVCRRWIFPPKMYGGILVPNQLEFPVHDPLLPYVQIWLQERAIVSRICPFLSWVIDWCHLPISALWHSLCWHLCYINVCNNQKGTKNRSLCYIRWHFIRWTMPFSIEDKGFQPAKKIIFHVYCREFFHKSFVFHKIKSFRKIMVNNSHSWATINDQDDGFEKFDKLITAAAGVKNKYTFQGPDNSRNENSRSSEEFIWHMISSVWQCSW